MKHAFLTLASALALLSANCRAEDVSQNIMLQADAAQPGHYSAALGATHLVSGLFVDTFSFDISAFMGQASAGLLTVGYNPSSRIDLILATLNDDPFEFTAQGPWSYGFKMDAQFTGPLTLTVLGVAGPGLPDGSAISASYGGSINVTPAVPEPATMTLMLAGLMGMGLVARRRAKAAV